MGPCCRARGRRSPTRRRVSRTILRWAVDVKPAHAGRDSIPRPGARPPTGLSWRSAVGATGTAGGAMTRASGLAMTWDEWSKHDAVGLAALVRKRAVTPRELARQAARAVELVNPRLAGVLEVFENTVEKPGVDGPARDGALYGVPLFLKDLGSGLRGRRQESGSRLFREHVMKTTDPAVENFLAAGLVPLGRSTTPEFGMTFDTATDYLGRLVVTRNPWNPERTP